MQSAVSGASWAHSDYLVNRVEQQDDNAKEALHLRTECKLKKTTLANKVVNAALSWIQRSGRDSDRH